MKEKFLLSDVETELMIHFEGKPGLESLASHLGRDVTVVSKQLKRISEKADVLTKVAGRWQLTEKGRRYIQISQDFLRSQTRVLSLRSELRIGTNREFASRVLSLRISEFRRRFETSDIDLKVYDNGTEEALLNGEIDISFDCGRPNSSELRYQQLITEAIFAVASQGFIKTHGLVKKPGDLSGLPHIYCERLRADRVAGKLWDVNDVVIRTNDIASARAMAIEGVGWALLPKYAIEPELNSGLLEKILKSGFKRERYGVWYLKTRHHLERDFNSACDWLSKVQL